MIRRNPDILAVLLLTLILVVGGQLASRIKHVRQPTFELTGYR